MNRHTLSILHTMNIAFITTLTIMGVVSLLYWLVIMVVSVMVWFDHFGWQRGFRDHQRIHNTVSNAIMRVIDREKRGEIKINNQDDFRKQFHEELRLSRYYELGDNDAKRRKAKTNTAKNKE